ncbi:glutamate--tRNA ligase [Sulfurimonas aquatica]|uniref:Glutamate--tRNA ligase n=1 Tax=Sulfurimonas aquatica TaxID=2672570 RepID=A0A975GCS1_9BACT|nr:glutamate--tRNA ligase family protein [Sulfurimonas aquatica]QSZ41797.1 glutamate--tRNA ligase [Sulfurimonas aquatica]
MLRFASSPTDDMSISDLRIAIFNYIISKQREEGLLVRIEDSNKEKNIEGKDQEILDTLALFGVEYSHVVYQSENVRFHSAMALQLMHEKKAFSCFCSQVWLEKKRQEAQDAKKAYKYDDACRNLPAELVIDNMSPFTIRVTKPEENLVIKDYIKGELKFPSDTLDSFVIMDQQKIPTYNFACAIDDMLGDISLVLHCEENMDNILKQDHIRASLKYDKKVEYAELPLIVDGDSISVKSLFTEGYLPSAISNYLISMGTIVPQKIFEIKDSIEWFDLKSISNSPIEFDMEALKKINKEHLKNLEAKELSRYVGFADEEIGELARVYLEEAATTKELRSKIEPIFADKEIPKEFVSKANIMAEAIKSAPYFDKYQDFKNYILKESGLKEENFSVPLRLLLTGAVNGPDISEIYKYLKNYIGEIVK